MSQQGNDAPFAVASDGTVFVNVTHHRGIKETEELLELAMIEEGAVFIGVELNPAEVDRVLGRLSHGAAEAVAYVIGRRMWKGGER